MNIKRAELCPVGRVRVNGALELVGSYRLVRAKCQICRNFMTNFKLEISQVGVFTPWESINATNL